MKIYLIKIIILLQVFSISMLSDTYAQTKPTKRKPTPKPVIRNTSPRKTSDQRKKDDDDRRTIDPNTLKMKKPLPESDYKEENSPRYIFEKELEKIKTVRLMQFEPDGTYDALPMKLDSVESIQMTFTQLMFNRILFLSVKPTNPNKPDIWVDLNYNEIREPNEIIDTAHKYFAIKVNQNVINFYGQIDTIQAYFFSTIPHDIKKAVVLKGDEKYICDRINTIDFSLSKSIKHIDLQGSNIEKAVFSLNPQLRSVYLDDNRMKSIDLRNCANLKILSCKNNQLHTIDPRGCFQLENLICSNNQLKDIPLSTLKNLKNLECKNNKIENLDITGAKELLSLDCSQNQLKSLILKNDKLNSININNNQITFLNVSECPELRSLSINKNHIYKFSFPKSPKITNLSFVENQMKFLDFSELPKLTQLDCSKNNFDSLDFTFNNNLQSINCSNNSISLIRFAEDNDIESLIVAKNKLDSFDLSALVNLKYFDCSDNSLNNLNLSNLNSLENINLSNNKLTELNFSGIETLKEVYCYNNSLKDSSMKAFIQSLKNSNNPKNTTNSSIYLLNNDLANEGNDISTSFDDLKALNKWNIYYVETDSDTLINLNISPNIYYADNVFLAYRGELPFVRMKSIFIKINGVAPPYNVAITNDKNKVITQYESASSFVDIKKLQSGTYSLRIAKNGKSNFYYFLK